MALPSLPGKTRAVMTALMLPPTSLLVIGAVGCGIWLRGNAALGGLLTSVSLCLLWCTSCNGVAVWLSGRLIPAFPLLAPADLGNLARVRGIEAIVILGSGIEHNSPEYGEVQLSSQSDARLRFGVTLSRLTGIPIGFAGGVGWTGIVSPGCSEAAAARAAALTWHGIELRWTDQESRDTRENAKNMAQCLKNDGVSRIALVTHACHMPRAVMAFENTGLTVLAAPMGFILAQERRLLEWVPSAHGLMPSRQVLREWIALCIARIRGGWTA